MKLIFQWGPAMVIMAVIFSFSSIPSEHLPGFGLLDFIIKKGAHMIGYGLLSLAFLWGLGHRNASRFILAWLLSVLFAASDEFHQSFVPGRGAWIVDVGIDAAGAFIALGLAYLLKKMRKSPLFPEF